MSAPDTNVKKQGEKHKTPLIGMGAAVLFAVILLIGLIAYVVSRGETPEGAATQIDGRTGDAVSTESGAGTVMPEPAN